MRDPQDSKTEDIKADESVFKTPRITLLKQEHWFYIQRRYRMSRRELQVAELVCKGLSNGEIAKELKMRPGTVKTHLRNVYRRIRVKNKIAMLLKVVDQATKFSSKSGITPPIPIVEIKKLAEKLSATAEIHKKEE
jgi:DNA-binding CsgD family transcriptional regulator